MTITVTLITGDFLPSRPEERLRWMHVRACALLNENKKITPHTVLVRCGSRCHGNWRAKKSRTRSRTHAHAKHLWPFQGIRHARARLPPQMHDSHVVCWVFIAVDVMVMVRIIINQLSAIVLH